MILLDTNVVSEPMRPQPDNRVAEWLDKQLVETLYLSAITVAGCMNSWSRWCYHYLQNGFCRLMMQRLAVMQPFVRMHAQKAKRLQRQTVILRQWHSNTALLWQRVMSLRFWRRA